MEQKTIKISRKKLTWAVIILAIIGVWWAYQTPDYEIIPMMRGGYGISDSVSSSVSRPDAPMMEKVGNMIYPDYYPQNPDIIDTHQFLKTSYSADIKTRDVKDVVRDVRGIVLGAEGRIDSIQESEKYSYVSFVVPKSKFNSFRNEIEDLTYEKLITINVSSENLHIEKQDTQFGNNIEIVNGYISINWISYWQMAKILSPIHPSIILIILILALWKILSLSRAVPKIELV